CTRSRPITPAMCVSRTRCSCPASWSWKSVSPSRKAAPGALPLSCMARRGITPTVLLAIALLSATLPSVLAAWGAGPAAVTDAGDDGAADVVRPRPPGVPDPPTPGAAVQVDYADVITLDTTLDTTGATTACDGLMRKVFVLDFGSLAA